VTPAVDRGPPLVRSRPFPVHEDLVASALERDAADVLDAYVYAHREWMLRAGGGPTLETTLELIVDGEPGPYSRGETPRTRPAGIGGR
jgi:hypothetical protein